MDIEANQAQVWVYATLMRNDPDGRQIYNLANTVVSQARQIADLRSALKRTEDNLLSSVHGRSVRTLDENLAENVLALRCLASADADRA